jgi:general secretion pathway protein D
MKLQVLIDVRILTVTFDNSKTTGIDWTQLYGLENFAINSLANAQKNISSFSFDNIDGAKGYKQGKNGNSSAGIVINIAGTTKISEIIKFLTTQGELKSISSPRVMALNNQPALISVGKELFYKIKSNNTNNSAGGTSSSQGELVDSVFAGILLDITPEIDTNGMITLKINPSISETINSADNHNNNVRSIPPDLIRRQISSVIKVKDGQHAILGGLISSKIGLKVNKVPLLGDIPLLEYAFKNEQKIHTVEELVLIITPHIVKNSKSISLNGLGYNRIK